MSTRKKTELRKRRRTYQRTRSNAKLHHEGAILVSIPESTRTTGFGLSLSYQKARDGKLPGAVKIDGRWFVHMPKLRAWLDSLADGKTGESAA
jgi:predicted DNA-binding transcriptional regulator AlpA